MAGGTTGRCRACGPWTPLDSGLNLLLPHATEGFFRRRRSLWAEPPGGGGPREGLPADGSSREMEALSWPVVGSSVPLGEEYDQSMEGNEGCGVGRLIAAFWRPSGVGEGTRCGAGFSKWKSGGQDQ